MDTISNVNKTNEQKEKYYDWNNIIEILDNFIPKFKEKNYKYIIGIPRGGLIIATLLSYKLNVPLILNYSELNDLSNVLIVDDIADSGKTLNKYKEFGFDSFTLFYKEKSTIKPTFVGEVKPEEEWIVFPWESW